MTDFVAERDEYINMDLKTEIREEMKEKEREKDGLHLVERIPFPSCALHLGCSPTLWERNVDRLQPIYAH
ncbi:hypothetical protein NPIL_540321 [Nephila pilipes]|uniref:Uncharacterized protein n=1 Tax=Nephila pilipes TaxID=299642 RepID=A0A8X6U5D8_NEPPI|nr:hypothetical protein NPIL_540321 [Nephila pilipes]